ncbi:hypothetical protein GJ688_14445 [Heliobacillus mobilis]|uniref:Peptidase MA-like domain-containing protein n=1 Tax=Heliobacterium mobile TaxID=28064 RepID=A0A6I3SMG2_HELMO|nr:hypothetical protein [Heliobacterium mobile]MTV50173.1 hypothetical protein [Heliobacterium mobile]
MKRFVVLILFIAAFIYIGSKNHLFPPKGLFDLEKTFKSAVQEGTQLVQSAVNNPEETQDKLNQRLTKILDDVNQLNQDLLAHARDPRRLAEQFGVRHLPRPKDPDVDARTQKTPVGLHIVPGDRGVSDSILQTATQLVQSTAMPILSVNLNHTPSDQTEIVLYSQKTTYGQALLQAGIDPNMILSIVQNTGGITIGSDVWIPLYNQQDRSMLGNVLTHELVHVVFNEEGIGEKLPTWMNEGIAWQLGMQAQKKLNPAMAREMTSLLNSQVRTASKQGRLLPLSASQEDILRADYNVEWEDYMAVDALVKKYGEEKLRTFLRDAVKKGVPNSFKACYGMTMEQYEAEFLASAQ